MKNKELFDRTIQILVKAYFKDVLDATECTACAVGNIVAENMGYNITPDFYWSDGNDDKIWAAWQVIVWGQNSAAAANRRKRAKAEILSTGYSSKELGRIESAFMFAHKEDKKTRDKVLIGLLAVVDVLCDIHEMNDPAKQEAKALFVKPAAIGIEATPSASEGTADSPAIAQNQSL